MSSNWNDSEIKALLLIRADEEICRHLKGTVSDAVTYEKITALLREQGIHRTKSQIVSKLKTLRLKFQKINDHHKQSGNDRISWAYFELCQSIWGSSHSTNPVALISSLTSEEPQTSTAVNVICDGSTTHSSDTEAPSCVEQTDSAEGFTQPPKKKTKKQKDHIENITRVLQTMETSFREQEAFRLQDQREYEEKLRQEAKEEQKEERASMMAMFKDMMEFQGNLLRQIMHPPLTTPLHRSPYCQSFSFPTTSSNYAATYHPQEQDAENSLHPQYQPSYSDLQN